MNGVTTNYFLNPSRVSVVVNSGLIEIEPRNNKSQVIECKSSFVNFLATVGSTIDMKSNKR